MLKSMQPILATAEASMQSDPFVRLQALQQHMAGPSSKQNLAAQAELAAGLVGAVSCSLMLLNSDDEDAPCMSIHAHYGPLPNAALQAAIRQGEGIAGHVLASGAAILVTDIACSAFAALARRAAHAGNSLMCAPIRIEGEVVGVINVANGAGAPAFDANALSLLEVTAVFIANTLQIQQLRYLLDSRFAQAALLWESQSGTAPDPGYRHPEAVAKLLARSFFRELIQAGFGSAQIVGAASELIGQLNRDIAGES